MDFAWPRAEPNKKTKRTRRNAQTRTVPTRSLKRAGRSVAALSDGGNAVRRPLLVATTGWPQKLGDRSVDAITKIGTNGDRSTQMAIHQPWKADEANGTRIRERERERAACQPVRTKLVARRNHSAAKKETHTFCRNGLSLESNPSNVNPTEANYGQNPIGANPADSLGPTLRTFTCLLHGSSIALGLTLLHCLTGSNASHCT